MNTPQRRLILLAQCHARKGDRHCEHHREKAPHFFLPGTVSGYYLV
jgi:hypothetical protein